MVFLQDVNSKTRNILEGVYKSHQLELKDLIKIKINYSESYIESIEKLFGNTLRKEEVYRILFGVEFESKSKDFYKLQLSKFKNDIFKRTKYN